MAGAEDICFVGRILFEGLGGRVREDVGTGRELTSIARSAFVSWTTPTTALATRMRRMTAGSTKAPKRVELAESSKKARRKETTAEARRMRTSWSLNWSRTSCHTGVGGSSGSSGGCQGEKGREGTAHRFCRREGRGWRPADRRGQLRGPPQSARGFGSRRASTVRQGGP